MKTAGCWTLILLAAIFSKWAQAASRGYGEKEEEWHGVIEQLSWKPRVFLLKSFLAEDECDHIIRASEPRLQQTMVTDISTGGPKMSTARTSSGAVFGRGHDVVFYRIERRIAAVTMVPVGHQEATQVLHYVDGQKFDIHYDAFQDPVNTHTENGGQRLLTMLMYLSSPDEGGETVFPFAEEHRAVGPGWSRCALGGFAHKPRKGDALMFYSLTPDGKVDAASQHGSCPTLKGTKWTATKWIHTHYYPDADALPAASMQHRDAAQISI